MNKVAFIGPQVIHEAFGHMEESWDMQVPISTIREFEDELASDDPNPRIAKETSLIIFFSRIYQEDPEGFANVVAYLSPYAVCCVLIPSQDMYMKAEIENAIKNAQNRMREQDEEYNVKTPFYFVTYENAQSEIFDAIFSFSKSKEIDPENARIAAQMLPNAQIPEIEEFYQTDDEPENIVIPEKDPTLKSKVISVTSSKGGSGKSTVAMLLAAYIAKASKVASALGKRAKPLKVVLVDLDVRDGQLGFLNAVMRPSVVDIVSEGDPTPANVTKGIWKNERTGVDFIFAAKRPRNATEISPSFYVELIDTLRAMYDVVILDTSVNYLDPLLEKVAYPMSDDIIFVSDFSVSSIFGMRRWIIETTDRTDDFGGDVNIPISKIKIVLNKSLNDINMNVEKIESSAKGVPIIAVYPNTPQLITYCSNTAQTDQILNEKTFFSTTQDIVEEIIPPEEALNTISFNDYTK